MKRYQSRTPLLVVLLIAAVMFSAISWLIGAVNVSVNAMQSVVVTALVAGIGMKVRRPRPAAATRD